MAFNSIIYLGCRNNITAISFSEGLPLHKNLLLVTTLCTKVLMKYLFLHITLYHPYDSYGQFYKACYILQSFLFFFLKLFDLSTWFLFLLTLESSARSLCQLQPFPSFWLFLVLFRMLRMPVTINKLNRLFQFVTWKFLNSK